MDIESHNPGTDLGLLAMRLATGGLMAGHGAQKLFGSFGGPRSNDVCRAAANVTCLAVGLFVLFALLGLSINALLRQ